MFRPEGLADSQTVVAKYFKETLRQCLEKGDLSDRLEFDRKFIDDQLMAVSFG